MISESKVTSETHRLVKELLNHLPDKYTAVNVKAAMVPIIHRWTLQMHHRIDKFRVEADHLYEEVHGDDGLGVRLQKANAEIIRLKKENDRLRAIGRMTGELEKVG